jgi:hypothetical protein
MIHRHLETSKHSKLVFEGRNLIGGVSRKGDTVLAIDRNGARLGIFPSSAEALARILQTPRRPLEIEGGR